MSVMLSKSKETKLSENAGFLLYNLRGLSVSCRRRLLFSVYRREDRKLEVIFREVRNNIY